MARSFIIWEAAAVLLLISAAVGNGGPVDMSHIASTGDLRLLNHPGVMLLSEELSITVERDHVSVVASYLLRNDGDTVELVYGFPVDRFQSGEFESTGEDITGFLISSDGVALPIGEPFVEDTLFVEMEGMIHSGKALRTWMPAELRLEAGSETVLEVAYSVRPCFMDWETTKDPFVSHSYRYFRYLLDPSGSWGDGCAAEFTCTIDARRLIENGGEVVTLPEQGEWTEPGLYVISDAGFDLASAPPLEIVYDPSLWMLSDEMSSRAVPYERIAGVLTSETLPPQAGNSYEARNLFDSDRTTAWAVSTDDTDPAPWIRVALRDVELGCLAIIGGYAKNAGTWSDNSRVAEVRLTMFGPDNWYWIEDHHIPESGFPGNAPLAAAFQIIFKTGEPVTVDSLLLEITGVHPGLLHNDLCISEILLTE